MILIKNQLDELVSKGATTSDSYSFIAKESDMVITMLPESHHVEHVVLGLNGILEGAETRIISN